MFDSVEDNRPRDKFPPRERDFNRPRGRDDFNDNRGRRDFSNGFGGGGFNKRQSYPRRDEEPNPKRNRFDSASDTFEPQFNSKEDANAIQPLMTFRKFLMTQEDGVSDNAEAVKKYNEYKIEYMKNAAQRFFEAHKDEEWFNHKYFPGHFEKRLEERKAALQKRLTVFEDLISSSDFNFTLDYNYTEDIIRLLDIAVIKLEDGTDEEIEAARTEEISDEAIIELKKMNGAQNDQNAQANGNKNGASKPAALQDRKKQEAHKTSSIYFKNVPPTISVDELEKICKEHPGFLRLGLSEPIPDQKFMRHAWATFRRDVNVKEIFWGLKGIKLANTDLGTSVNRDIRRRIRWVDGITKHRTVAQNDLKLAAKLVVLLDYKTGLYTEEDSKEAPTDLEVAIARSKNPVLDNITEFLIEEANAEEDVLLGLNESENVEAKQAFEVDEEMLKTLDKVILYLRIVHSFDFYAHLQYPNEDHMPNRLGLFHVRGVSPDGSKHGKNASDQPLITKAEVDEYINKFNEHFTSILKFEVPSDEDLEKLGKKDPDKAVEQFIEANTVEVGKDKWLCPLSGKKFKGPEFIQKHLTSKHQERLDLERDTAIYYNNYISDPDRPQEVEVKPQATSDKPASNLNNSGPIDDRSSERPRERLAIHDRGYPRFGGGGGGFSNGGGFGRGGGRYFDRGGGDRRHQPSYRDLDAPDE